MSKNRKLNDEVKRLYDRYKSLAEQVGDIEHFHEIEQIEARVSKIFWEDTSLRRLNEENLRRFLRLADTLNAVPNHHLLLYIDRNRNE